MKTINCLRFIENNINLFVKMLTITLLILHVIVGIYF
jgi:hypothetical protein